MFKYKCHTKQATINIGIKLHNMATPIDAGQLLFVDNSPEMDTAATWVAQRDGAIIITENPFDDTVDAIFIRNDHRMPFRSSYFKRALQLLDPDVYMYEEEEGKTSLYSGLLFKECWTEM